MLAKRLPPLKNWQDFEILCHRLWQEIWNDPTAQRNGRQGQPQNGVDIWGHTLRHNLMAGVQCKDKDSRFGSELTVAELKAECKKAKGFKPALNEFTMATSAPRDQALQKTARLMTAERTHPFSVHVWSWDEIEEEIKYRPGLVSAFYPEFIGASFGDGRKLTLSLLAPRDQITAFFSRPEMETGIAQNVRAHLLPVAFEFAENSFIHGHATRFSVQCEKDVVRFEDDGGAFNPLVSLDASKVSARSHIGSFVFASLQRRFGTDLTVSYERTGDINRLTLKFAGALSGFGAPTRIDIPIDLTHVYSRDTARRVAASIGISKETKELALVVTGIAIHSGVCEFFWALAARLTPEMSLQISVPDNDTADFLKSIFASDSRITFVSRQGA